MKSPSYGGVVGRSEVKGGRRIAKTILQEAANSIQARGANISKLLIEKKGWDCNTVGRGQGGR